MATLVLTKRRETERVQLEKECKKDKLEMKKDGEINTTFMKQPTHIPVVDQSMIGMQLEILCKLNNDELHWFKGKVIKVSNGKNIKYVGFSISSNGMRVNSD